MILRLSHPTKETNGSIKVTGSKSESNRLLILKAIYPEIDITNLSNSDDTQVLQTALVRKESEIDIHHAGTAMRFLTAYYASLPENEVQLTGSQRMQERPISILVDALRSLGADIEYLEKEGFPPLRIKGKSLRKEEVRIAAGTSSQYISALMLIAPSLPYGLKIHLEGSVTSAPYLMMTLNLMKACGLSGSFSGNLIHIPPIKVIDPVTIAVESDWSSASYFYSIAALSQKADLRLTTYKEDSLQGDRVIADIFTAFGVETSFSGGSLHLRKQQDLHPENVTLDLTKAPDLAQTIAVTCFATRVPCRLTGLHTLRIKETDRLAALKTEIEKFGGEVVLTEDTLELLPFSRSFQEGVKVETYHDHRMALAFAPLSLKVPLEIDQAQVVSKSFPEYWRDLKEVGFSVE